MDVVVKRRSSAPLVFGLLLLLMGAFFSGVVAFRDAPLALFGLRTGAVVEKVTEEPNHTSRKSRPSYRLHLLFTLPNGESARFDSLSTWGHTLQAGDEVAIIYRPGPPLRGEVYSARQLWLPLATGTIASAVCLLGGYAILRHRFRSKA